MSGPRFTNEPVAAAHLASNRARRALLGKLLLGFAAIQGLSASVATAQSESSTSNKPVPGESTLGAIGRFSHLGFETFGRSSSISPVEIFPYAVEGDHFLFGDFRGFVSNYGQFGGNFGLGYRYLNEGMMSWYGGSLWYDVDDSTGELFHQVGLSLDAVIESWEVRSNLYLPVGDTQKAFGSENFAAEFVGNQLLFDSTTKYGSAMKGVDIEGGYGLPLDLFGFESAIRGFVGGYFFNGDDVDNVNGVKVRGELVVNNAVTTQLLYTNDDTFGSNVMVGMTFDFPFGSDHPSSRWGRAMPSPYRPVERNYNVIVSQFDSSVQNVVAINPRTGQPYEVQHVSATGSAGGDGSVNDAWATVGQAQAAGADLIYVHSNTVLGEQITLVSGQSLLGEMAGQHVLDANYGSLLLPATAAGATPRISGVNGPAVTLASNTTFGGFQIDNITGNGIVGNSASNVVLRDLTFSGISGDAVQLNDSTGSLALNSLSFLNTPGRGLVIDGGTANVEVTGQFDNVGGDAVTLADLTGGTVALNGLSITDGGARGIVTSNLAADLTIDELTVTNNGGDAVVFDGGDGDILLSGLTTIQDSLARGLVFSNLDSESIEIEELLVNSSAAADAVTVDNVSGEITFHSITLDLENGRGLVANEADSLIVKGGTITTTNAAGVDIEDSDVTSQLKTVSVDGGPVGIRIVDTTGSFAVAGPTSIIRNTDTAVLLNNVGTVVFQIFGLENNGVGISSTGAEYLVIDTIEIIGSTHYAIDSMNDRLLSISNASFKDNGTLGEGTVRVRADEFGTYQTQLLSTTIEDSIGTAIDFESLAGANGSTLGVLLQNTKVTGERGGESLLRVNWNGPVGVTLAMNQFVLSEDNMTAVEVLSTSATDRLTINAQTNAVQIDGASGTGFLVNAAATSTLQFNGNGVGLNDGNGVGYNFVLQDDANVTFVSNYVVDNAFGGTAVLFDQIAAGSSVEISNNQFDFLSTGLLVDQGIIFNTVGDTVQLTSNRNNVINGATNALTVPAGKTTGRLRINGVNLPQ